jgi:ADP-ribose pyrophosphatase
MKFETLNSEAVYQGKAFRVRRDQVRLPDGQSARLDIVEHIGAVTILPLDDQGRIWFVRQYRHPAAQELLELPAGTLEPGEPPEVCAHREIREETGQAAGEMRKIGEFFLAPGYSTEYMYVFLATQLRPDPLPSDGDEFLSVETRPVAEVFQMVERGEIQDGKTLAALMLARRWLA